MPFSFLVFSVGCIWWDYNYAEYALKERDSMHNPIFALCTSPSCPHCHGLLDIIKEVAKSLENKTSVVFTHFDCSNNHVCAKASVLGVPQLILIRGSDPKYWRRTGKRTSDEWVRFLIDELEPKVTEVDESELNDLISDTSDGASVFSLMFPHDNRDIFKKYKKAAALMSFYGCEFTYIYRPDKPSTMTAYLSPSCNVTSKVKATELIDFVDVNKYSHFHEYSLSELRNVSMRTPTFLVAPDGNLTIDDVDMIAEISAQNCGTMAIGWVNPSRGLDIMKFTAMEKSDLPSVVAVDMKNDCIMKERLSEFTSDKEEFFRKLQTREECKSVISLEKGYQEGGKNRKKSFAKISAIILVACLAAGALAYLIRGYRRELEQKME